MFVCFVYFCHVISMRHIRYVRANLMSTIVYHTERTIGGKYATSAALSF